MPALVSRLKKSSVIVLLTVVSIVLTGCSLLLYREPHITYYYIDKTGKKVLDGQGYFGDSFKDGLALVCDDYCPEANRQHLRYIDHTGKTRLELDAIAASPFSEGFAVVVDDSAQRGYIDKTGKWRIPAKFSQASPFSNGLAWVLSSDLKEQYIDKNGQTVLDAEQILGEKIAWRGLAYGGGRLGSFQNNMVFAKGKKKEFIDRSGNFAVDLPETTDFASYSGPHCITINDGSGAYLFDSITKKRVELDGSSVGAFSEGLAAIKDKDLCGFVNESGKTVIPPRFRRVSPFSEGLAAVQVEGKTGYIDRSGKLVIQPEYLYGGDFSEGVAVVVPLQKSIQMNEYGLYLWGTPSGVDYTHGPLDWNLRQIVDD